MNLTKKQAKRLGVLDAAVPAPQAKQPRQAPSEPPTGLWVLIGKGWSVESTDSIQYRLYVINSPHHDTGLCPTEKSACDRAKELLRCE